MDSHIKIVGNTKIRLDPERYEGKMLWMIRMEEMDTGMESGWGMTPKVARGLVELIKEAGHASE